MGIHPLPAQFEPLARDAFVERPGLACGVQTRVVPNGDHDFETLHVKFCPCVSGERADRCRRGALALPRLAHPVTQVAKSMHRVDLVQAATADEHTGMTVDDGKLEAGRIGPSVLAGGDPGQRGAG